jgi:group I intron endonuclease
MIGIYKITNPKGKIYIGQSINIESRKRIYQYYESYKNSIGPKIYNSINKHEWKNHSHEIIEECTIEQLNEREIYWKQYYLNKVGWKNVLFCNLHDSGGGPKSEETKQNISKGKMGTKGYPKGVKRSEEFRKKISSNKERNKKIGEKNKGKSKPGSGHHKPLSTKHKNNISKNSKGVSRNQKAILQYDLKGNFIKKWESITKASLSIGVNQSCISDVLRGRQKQTKGFLFKFG